MHQAQVVWIFLTLELAVDVLQYLFAQFAEQQIDLSQAERCWKPGE
jgi:hypothetical protein